MGYLHERGVKGYVTLNVLLFDEELQRAEQTIRVIAASGADAVIVQVVAQEYPYRVCAGWALLMMFTRSSTMDRT